MRPSPHSRKEAQEPPVLSPCLLWPSGRPCQLLLVEMSDEDAIFHTRHILALYDISIFY